MFLVLAILYHSLHHFRIMSKLLGFMKNIRYSLKLVYFVRPHISNEYARTGFFYNRSLSKPMATKYQ